MRSVSGSYWETKDRSRRLVSEKVTPQNPKPNKRDLGHWYWKDRTLSRVTERRLERLSRGVLCKPWVSLCPSGVSEVLLLYNLRLLYKSTRKKDRHPRPRTKPGIFESPLLFIRNRTF